MSIFAHTFYLQNNFTSTLLSIRNFYSMDIKYYKIEKESELGKLAARLLGDMEDADRIADIVADKYCA